jgi:hypothetical protein
MSTNPTEAIWVDQFVSALSRLEMPETATIGVLTELGRSLYGTQAHLSPQVAADTERREWPPRESFPNGGRRQQD